MERWRWSNSWDWPQSKRWEMIVLWSISSGRYNRITTDRERGGGGGREILIFLSEFFPERKAHSWTRWKRVSCSSTCVQYENGQFSFWFPPSRCIEQNQLGEVDRIQSWWNALCIQHVMIFHRWRTRSNCYSASPSTSLFHFHFKIKINLINLRFLDFGQVVNSTIGGVENSKKKNYKQIKFIRVIFHWCPVSSGEKKWP